MQKEKTNQEEHQKNGSHRMLKIEEASKLLHAKWNECS